MSKYFVILRAEQVTPRLISKFHLAPRYSLDGSKALVRFHEELPLGKTLNEEQARELMRGPAWNEHHILNKAKRFLGIN